MLVPAEVWTVAKAEQGNAVLVRPLGLDVAVPTGRSDRGLGAGVTVLGPFVM